VVKKKKWYKLDNAGVLYSALQREEYSAVYRFSAVMTETVAPAALQNAVDAVLPRFPGFSVRIRQGLFWYYFEPNTAPGPFLKPDVADPCQPIRFHEDAGWLIRFYYYQNRISFEAFHALADGVGALTFFRTLLAEYLRQTGVAVPAGEGVLGLNEPPRREELEDAYARYVGPAARRLPLVKHAYSNRGQAEPFYTFHVTMGFVPVDKLREKAHGYRVSVTEYLAAALLWVLAEKQRRENYHQMRPVTLAVPVNLRPYFPSETLRNFLVTVQPGFDPALGKYSFSEVAAQVHNYMKLHTAPQEMQAQITRNVRYQSNPVLQLIPQVLKSPIVARNYRTRGVRPFSATFTNPGAFTVPEAMRPHIRHMEVVLGQATVPRPHVASISYGNIMEITMAGTQADADTERALFRFLVREGLPVHVESNRTGAERRM
jgi:hypothetical protein